MSFKGQIFYFAVAESPERHATVWRLWSPTNKGDAYLGPRFHAGKMKLSIHERGLRHLREKKAEGAAPTDVLRWFGPRRHMPGFEVVWHIVTPFGVSRVAKLPQRFKDRVTWIPQTAREFTATEFELVLSFGLIFRQGEYPCSEVLGTECLLRWHLANGETLFLLRRSAEMTQGMSMRLGHALISMPLPPTWEQRKRDFDHRALIIFEHEERRGCFDLAYDV